MRVTKKLLNNLVCGEKFYPSLCDNFLSKNNIVLPGGRLDRIRLLRIQMQALAALISQYCAGLRPDTMGEPDATIGPTGIADAITTAARIIACIIVKMSEAGNIDGWWLQSLMEKIMTISYSEGYGIWGSLVCSRLNEAWEEVRDEFEELFRSPLPIPEVSPITVCPPNIPIEVNHPWWVDLLTIGLLDGVNPEDLEAAGAICTGVGIAVGLVAAGLTGVGAVSGLSALPAGEAAVAGAALLAVLPSIDEAQAAEIVGGIIEKAETCSVDESHCCLPGGEDPPDGIDQDGCYALDGEWTTDKCGGLEVVK